MCSSDLPSWTIRGTDDLFLFKCGLASKVGLRHLSWNNSGGSTTESTDTPPFSHLPRRVHAILVISPLPLRGGLSGIGPTEAKLTHARHVTSYHSQQHCARVEAHLLTHILPLIVVFSIQFYFLKVCFARFRLL